MFKLVLLMHVKFREVFCLYYAKALKIFGLVSGRRVQRRYNLSETTLQQGYFMGMVHKYVFDVNFEPIEIAWGYHLSFYLSHSPIRDDSIHRG